MKNPSKSWLHLQRTPPGSGGPRNGNGGTKNGSRAEHGVLVLDQQFLVVAADDGATAIVKRAGENVDLTEPAATLPAGLSDALKRAAPQHGRVKIGTDVYLCHSFELNGERDRDAATPAAVIYLQRDVGIADFIEAVANKYHLTERERCAVEGVVLGLSSKDIAKQMEVAPSTVKSFLRTVMIKMGVSTRTAIMREVLQLDTQDASS